MQEVNFLQSLHSATKRDYLARMNAEKPDCMRIAKQYGKDYWDGDRKYGYGGYKFDARWKSVAESMIEYYGTKILNRESSVLDIGCGKGSLLKELSLITHGKYTGCENNNYPVENGFYNIHRQDAKFLGYASAIFDFTYSINVFHNLGYKDLKHAIREMVRVTKPDGQSYICVESYRNEEELCNLQCWALTCQSFYSPDDWKEILTDNGYKGDVEFITFQ